MGLLGQVGAGHQLLGFYRSRPTAAQAALASSPCRPGALVGGHVRGGQQPQDGPLEVRSKTQVRLLLLVEQDQADVGRLN